MSQSGLCPKGPDPMRPVRSYYTINITTRSNAEMGGYFLVSFLGEAFSFPANAIETSLFDMEEAWQALYGVEDVRVFQTNTSLLGATYAIQFLAYPKQPYMNNIFEHDGNPSLQDILCKTSFVTGGGGEVSCEVTQVQSLSDGGMSNGMICFW